MRAKKQKKRGSTGRRWTRKDRPTLRLGQPDKSGMLETVTPDAGTKGGHRYCLAQCLCGCDAVVEIRIDNFLAGKASCPTRRKAANRRAMEQKKHIEMMRLINVISNGKNLPGTARDAAVRYACHVAADTPATGSDTGTQQQEPCRTRHQTLYGACSEARCQGCHAAPSC